MQNTIISALSDLRDVLLALEPTGEQGFEGLMKVALQSATGVPLRLAKSGTQRGLDGKTLVGNNSVCFEAKRYSSKMQRSEVITKIADLSRNNDEPDMVWALCATVPVSTQDADDLQTDGVRGGISVVILDWSETSIPILAVVLAISKIAVADFLNSNLPTHPTLKGAIQALEDIAADPSFSFISEAVLRTLDAPSMGVVMAQGANRKWLSQVFSDRRQAEAWISQPLAPGASPEDEILPRRALTKVIEDKLSVRAGAKTLFVLGDEGCGKSWVVALSWLRLQDKPLLVFVSAESAKDATQPDAFRVLVIQKLIEQTGRATTDKERLRWEQRLAKWENMSPTVEPRLVVVIDGINQRPHSDWGRIIESASLSMEKIGGSLLVTSREQYFRERLERRMLSEFDMLHIPEWTNEERNTILRRWNISPAKVHAPVAQSLRNPRLLDIALRLLKKTDIESIEELSVSRLLFEHIRSVEGYEVHSEPAVDFVVRLQDHARQILQRYPDNQRDVDVFDRDMGAVVDGRFFELLKGEPGKYKLRREGLSLALGLALISEIARSIRIGNNPQEALAAIIEPVAALDDVADVVLSALSVAAHDHEYRAPGVISALVSGFASLQNPNEAAFPAFCLVARKQPEEFMQAAESLCLTQLHRPNFDWIRGAMFNASSSPDAWAEIENAVRRWLKSYSLEPDSRRFPSRNTKDPDETEKRRSEARAKIMSATSLMSDYERNLLKQLNEVNGEFGTLWTMAFHLLAGRALKSYAKELVSWCFSNALNPAFDGSATTFQHLIRFNSVDWHETRHEFLSAGAPLKVEHISNTGKWALVRLLDASGEPSDSMEKAKSCVQ